MLSMEIQSPLDAVRRYYFALCLPRSWCLVFCIALPNSLNSALTDQYRKRFDETLRDSGNQYSRYCNNVAALPSQCWLALL